VKRKSILDIPHAHNAAMGKRAKVVLALLAVALVGVIVWQTWRPHEPVYEGKPLSFWLKGYTPRGLGEAEEKADDAVRQAGSNAVPTLLQLVWAKDSALKVKLMTLAKGQHFIQFTPAEYWHRAAIIAFEVLSTNAQSAVPTLLQWTTTNVDVNVRSTAISALGAIHAQPHLVVPVLTNALQDPSSDTRERAVSALGQFGRDAEVAVPALLDFLNAPQNSNSMWFAITALKHVDPAAAAGEMLRWATNANFQLRLFAIVNLGDIHVEPDRAVPLLINSLHDPIPHIPPNAVVALGRFGPEAKLAVPALVEFLNTYTGNSPFQYVARSYATNALKAIDPEAAAKAGITNNPLKSPSK
jgi:HEAT repeat protein